MKKKILFVVTYFDCGGINRSLQNILNCIDTDLYDVDVFGMVPDGMFANLYKNCHVLTRHRLLAVLMSRYSQQRGLRKLMCLIIKVLNKVSYGYFGRCIKKRSAQKLLKNGYDTVVAFSEGAPTSFVAYMNHSNSVAWIHCDYNSYKLLNGFKNEGSLYSHFKHIVCVANYPRQQFLLCYPEFASRTTTIYNIHDVDMMKSLAACGVEESFSKGGYHIVSIGRLDPVKRLSLVPIIAKKLIDAGCRFDWFIIGPKGGSANEYEKLMNNISELGVGDVVHYIGEKDNPYSYISRADILVNTSISEACPYVINEAKILHTPVVCTDFGSASEFVDDGINGFICPIEQMPITITRYLKDVKLQNLIKNSISTFNYDNKVLLEQVYMVLG